MAKALDKLIPVNYKLFSIFTAFSRQSPPLLTINSGKILEGILVTPHPG